MKKLALLPVLAACPLIGVVLAQQPDRPSSRDAAAQPDPSMIEGMPPMPPPPGEHHEWLQQLVGTWTVESEMMVGEGMPAMECTGTDTVRSLGGRWVLCDLHSEMPGMGAMDAVLTLGYNPETGKYQGTWVDSMTDHMWVYEGTLDDTGKILTLEAEGPNMMDPTAGMARYRDVIEIKSPDHRTLSSFAQVEGEWVQFVTAHYRRTE
jgi:hypothetical protein